MNYASLKADLASYLNRADLGAVIPGFIERAEAFLSREFYPSDTETKASGVTVGGLIVLPSDFGELRRVTITANGATRTLDYGTPDADYSGGTPRTYAFEGGAIRLFPDAGDGYAYALHYRPTLAALSDGAPTNWLTGVAPDLYLYASALEAAAYLKNDGEIARIGAKLPAMIESVRGHIKRRAMPTLSGLRVMPRGVIGGAGPR